jgi:hypothetical protein
MDAASWVVTVLFGAVIGTGLARFPDDRRIVLGAIAGMILIGLVTWVISPESIAGPSLTVGGLAAALATTIARPRGTNR